MKRLFNKIVLLSTIMTLFFLVLGLVSPAFAHGKEVEIIISSVIPDLGNPLRRLYRAEVIYTDGDAVEEAVMELFAVRDEGGQGVGPIEFYPLGEPGLYATEVEYERFGNWVITVSVTEPGEGEAEFTDEIFPGQAGSNSSEETDNVGIPESLSILFEFDWEDFINIVLRFVHSLAGLAWFSLVGIIIVAYWFMSPGSRIDTFKRLNGFFAPVSGLSLAVLLGSGIYNGIWDAPIRPPGVFDINTMLQIPFGDIYLLAFLGKVLAYIVLASVTVRLRKALKEFSPGGLVTSLESEAEVTLELARFAKIGMGTAVFLAVNIAVLIYMHYISHLAVLIPN